ncbi:uncharacterized protein EV154DRAFT_513734 [Mucor mucedo]|uniref:uncharacterized protein n=1 Tax=Mucor mucedo TaxID=29922 RepID=UPI0022209578|nr:uncharacterized protein EV154DRAFT_513734 [Mucor mucedo]KAI7889682.1 hypothetical protein EV154DRAFT_513734 [Mucor mucedo]
MNNTNNSLRFDKGVMRLSAFDPQSNQYETRILKLPELPLLESLENMFDNSGRKILRMTKSCCNSKKPVNGSSTSLNSIGSQPRRCQSQPDLSKQQQQQQQQQQKQQQQQQQQQRKKTVFVSSTRSKKTLSSAFQAVAGLFQKGTNTSSNEKMSLQQRQNLTCDNWWMSSPPISSC